MNPNSLEPLNYQPSSDSEEFSPSFESKPKQGRTSWILGFLTLFLIASGCYLAFRQFAMPQQQAADRPKPISVERGNLKVTVSANGTVQPEKLVNVSPKNSGILKELYVEEGDYVKKGQAIAKMDDSNLKGQLIEAEGRLAEAQANLRKLINGNRPQEIAQAQAKLEELEANLRKLIAGSRSQEIGQAEARLDAVKATYQQAEDEYKRNEELFQEGAISQQTLNEKLAIRDNAKASVVEAKEEVSLSKEGTRQEEIDQARAEVKNQQQVLDLLQEGTRQEEIDQARAEVKSTKGSLQTIQTLLDDTIIRAPFDGIISQKYADPGSFVTPTTSGSNVNSATSSSILSLASDNRIEANVAENNIAKIRVGQKVIIEADAFPGETFSGKVSQIATQATVEQNVTSFEVKVALDEKAQKQLSAGMNVSVDFQVGELENVLLVPSKSVTTQDNITGVYVGAPNQPPKFVPITVGATADNYTEVKSGLEGTEHILTDVPSQPPPQSGFSLNSLFRGFSNDGSPSGGPPGGGPPGDRPPGGGGPR